MPVPEPIARLEFDAAKLAETFPPDLHHPNKKIVHSIACPPNRPLAGHVVFTRWQALPLPAKLEASSTEPAVTLHPGFFLYEPATDPLTVEWHLNFADPHLFGYYDGGLFAQDEMQVAEHPILASIPPAVSAHGEQPLTVADGAPTPCLVTGAERRCAIATDPNASEGRPDGLYGNRFAAASGRTVERATHPIVPPTISNILAMAAPHPGTGEYDRAEIEQVLVTAFTGFTAARLESRRLAGDAARCIVHTGHWGCGAFGGNRVLMAVLQLVAARLAAVEGVVYHGGDEAGLEPVREAQKLRRQFTRQPSDSMEPTVESLIREFVDWGFQWGVSDGN